MKMFLCMPFTYIIIKYASIQRDLQLKFRVMKQFDTISFRAASQKRRNSLYRDQTFEPPISKPQPKNWREMTYRFEQRKPNLEKSIPVYQSHYINDRIGKIDQQLTENIRRRIDLQKKLYEQKRQNRQKENQRFFKQNYVKSDLQRTETFVNIEKKSQAISNMIFRQSQPSKQQYLSQIEGKITKQNQYVLKKNKTQKKYLVPDQVRLQKLLRSATFPESPNCNLEKMEQQCQQIIINSQHSDAVYIMMVVSFHLQKYHNVRKYFRQIQMYKVFQSKAYWVACQAQYQLESYELCLKLADKCMKQLSDLHFPRFVFLQARSYEKLGNYINSVVCYNQLIKMKPKVGQLYLQRGIIYDKIGYPMQAKQDYIQFSVLQPEAKQTLKQKIMTEQNQIKRKQLIKALAKIT